LPRWPALTVLGASLLGFGAVGLVLDRVGSRELRPLRARWLVTVGKLSYGLYIYHLIIFCLSDDAASWFGLSGRPLWRVALASAATFGVAALSWRYFEHPILKLKHRFAYHSPRVAALPGPHGIVSPGQLPALRLGLGTNLADGSRFSRRVDSHGLFP
jgi:peptidoglycan/LPS O-acetylase OafA/YrhL